MKIIFVVMFLIIISLSIAGLGFCGSLDDAQSSSDNLYGYASKASTANNDYDANSRARETASAAQSAVNDAIDAGSYDAATDASEALDYSRKAATATNAEDARFYSRQAEKAASGAQSAISYDKSNRKSSSGSSSDSYSGIASASDYVSDSDYDTETSSDY